MPRIDNPSTSYRLGKPTKCKNTPQHTKHETPRTPWNAQKILNSYFRGIFLVFSGYFSGIFGVFFRSLAVGGVCMSGWYFWPILGFVGFSAL